MLPSIQEAVSHKARRNVAIARDMDRAAITVTLWFSGGMYIPAKVRRALDTAIGHPVDWLAYEAEFAAEAERRAAARAAAAPRPDAPPPAPVAPAPVAPAPVAPRKLTATPPRPRPAPPPPPKQTTTPPAPPIAPAVLGGFFSRLMAPPEKDLFE